MFRWFRKWRNKYEDLTSAVKETKEASAAVNQAFGAAMEVIKDERVLSLMRKAKIELIEAKMSLRKLVK